MHLFIFSTILLICSIQSYSQGFQLEWTKSIPGNSSESIYQITKDISNGNVYAIGHFRDSIEQLSTNQTDESFIASFRKDGVLNWIKKLNTNGANQGLGIHTDNNGYIYASGAYNNTIQTTNNEQQTTR